MSRFTQEYVDAYLARMQLRPGPQYYTIEPAPPPRLPPRAPPRPLVPEDALTLPWPPSANKHTLTVAPGQKRPLSPSWRAYRETVAGIVQQQWRPRPALAGALYVSLFFYPPDKRRRDIDNPVKAILDGLTHSGIWRDDVQVRAMYLAWQEPATPGYVLLQILPIREEIPHGQPLSTP